MRIVLTRVTATQHRIELIRSDGFREAAELETRSHLMHDLTHYAVEAEAGLTAGFFGLLATGTSLSKLHERGGNALKGLDPAAELALAEGVVGPVTSLVQGQTDAAGLLRMFHERFRSGGDRIPSWLNDGFLMRVMERMRRLLGQWKATPFGGRMELVWPPDGQQPQH